MTPGNILTTGQNRVGSIDRIGVNNNSAVPARVQQANALNNSVNAQPKGTKFSITITNPGGVGSGNFLLFDSLGLAALYGAPATSGGVVIKATFGGRNDAAAYVALTKFIAGTRIGSVGAAFTFGNASYIQTTALQVWNGNLENYNSRSLQDDLTASKDTYANDQATLIMGTALYLNQFFALAGTLPDLGGGNTSSLQILFNVALVKNW